MCLGSMSSKKGGLESTQNEPADVLEFHSENGWNSRCIPAMMSASDIYPGILQHLRSTSLKRRLNRLNRPDTSWT